VRHRLLLSSLTSACLAISAGLVQAQEQENKLIDRIMRPDMSLSNPAQNKKFVAAEGTSINRKFETKSFYSGQEHTSKPFAGIRNFFARTFGAKRFSHDQTAAMANAESSYAKRQALTKTSSLMRTAPEQSQTAATRAYADNRPFLAKGTRQEILNKKNHPLTIDEVRELLNKNE
jgi:hypothetical protein